jgi:hypothetical protein
MGSDPDPWVSDTFDTEIDELLVKALLAARNVSIVLVVVAFSTTIVSPLDTLNGRWLFSERVVLLFDIAVFNVSVDPDGIGASWLG